MRCNDRVGDVEDGFNPAGIWDGESGVRRCQTVGQSVERFNHLFQIGIGPPELLRRSRDLGSGGSTARLPLLLTLGRGNDVASDKGMLVNEAVALGAAVGQDGASLRLCDQVIVTSCVTS